MPRLQNAYQKLKAKKDGTAFANVFFVHKEKVTNLNIKDENEKL